MTTLGVHGLTKQYGGTTVLDAVSFETRPGRALAVRGPNGAGKTTLLRCLAGTVPADSGDVTIDGAARDPGDSVASESIYGVLDDFAWFPDLTVGDHLHLLDPHGDPGVALRRFGAEGLVHRTAASLSSGQMRRAALATTLCRPWDVLLLDEPEQRLDDRGTQLLVRELSSFLAQGRCVILSTHSDELHAALAADTVRLA
jgi:ABC-type multidrug transport system ATPase subunit